MSLFEITRKTLGNMSYPYGFPLAGKTENVIAQTTIGNTTTQDLHGFGETTQGQLGVQSTTKYSFRALTSLNNFGFSPFLQSILIIAGGDRFHSFVQRNNGIIIQDYVYTWGINGKYELGRGGKDADTCGNILAYQSGPGRIDLSFTFTGNDSIRMIDSGYHHTHVVTNSNRVFNWGDNYYGQLGRSQGLQDYSTLSGLVPQEVTFSLGSDTVHSVYGGRHHSVLLTNQGNVYAYGDNTYSQLARDPKTTLSFSTTPVLIPGLTNVVLVAAGEYFSVALKTDGTIWGWGHNPLGQLTGETTFDNSRIQETPIRIGTLTDIVHVSAGANHIVVLRKNATLRVYGDNTYLQGSIPPQNSNITFVSAIRNNTFFTDVAGTLWGFGQGANQGSYLLGIEQETIGIPIYITSLPAININVGYVYDEFLSKTFTFNTANNQGPSGENVVCLRFDEDLILSSSEYLRDTKAIRQLGCIAQRTNSTCTPSTCTNPASVKFTSYKEKLLYERGLFIRNMCCLNKVS